jgi:hypothetical protein
LSKLIAFTLAGALNTQNMIWLCLILIAVSLIVLAGRAHSRHLDRQENLLADAALARKKQSEQQNK